MDKTIIKYNLYIEVKSFVLSSRSVFISIAVPFQKGSMQVSTDEIDFEQSNWYVVLPLYYLRSCMIGKHCKTSHN